MKAPKVVKKRPAEFGTAASVPLLTALLVSFGLELEKAAAISACVVAFLPAVITFAVEKYRALQAAKEDLEEKAEDLGF